MRVKITVIAAGFKEANKKNTTQRPQFMPRTWKAGREEGTELQQLWLRQAGAKSAFHRDVVQRSRKTSTKSRGKCPATIWTFRRFCGAKPPRRNSP